MSVTATSRPVPTWLRCSVRFFFVGLLGSLSWLFSLGFLGLLAIAVVAFEWAVPGWAWAVPFLIGMPLGAAFETWGVKH